MSEANFRKLTGILLIVTPILLNILFTLLGMMFEYPDILRMPTGDVLARFQAGGSGLIAIWYAMTITTAFFIPIVLLMRRLLKDQDPPNVFFATTFGVIAGMVQILGFIRWPFLVPYLTRVYFDPASSETTRESAALIFQVFNQYAGVAIGEHLGYLFTALWIIFLGMTMLKRPFHKPWLARIGFILAVGILSGMLEPVGVAWAGLVNFIAYTLWAFWLMALGVAVLRFQNNGHRDV